MKLYVIKSEIDGTYYCHNGTDKSWGDFDNCTIKDKVAIDNLFNGMSKKFRSEKHPVVCELNIIEPYIVSGEAKCQSQILDSTIPSLNTKKSIPIEEYKDKTFAEILDGTDCSEQIVNILNYLEKVIELKTNFQGVPNQQLSEADKKLCDIYHYIEFNKFNGAKGYKLSKLQKEILTERRTAKNDFLILNHINDVLKGVDSNSLAKLKYNCLQVNDREYSPRTTVNLDDI